MIKLKNLLKENESSINLAYQKIDELPTGKLFDDAKNIEGIFKKSQHSWNDVIVTYMGSVNLCGLLVVNVMGFP